MKSWKTNIGAALNGLGTCIILADPHWLKIGLVINAFGTFFGLLFAKDYDKTGVYKVKPGKARRMSGKAVAVLLMVGLWLLCSGCSSLVTDQVETALDGTTRKTHVRAYTLFDGKSDLAKLRATATDKSQGVTVSGLSQESSGSNVVNAVESITAAAVGAAVKALR